MGIMDKFSTKIRLNASISLISQILKLLTQFILQTLFVRNLGIEYLGVNGLFSNLLMFLSFTELGIGASFNFILYEPIIKKDYVQVNVIIRLFRKIYTYIGITILGLGFFISIFLPSLVSGAENIVHLRGLFILFLISSAVTYFFTYYRTLLIANQESYLDSLNQLVFLLLRFVLQIIVLVIFKSYVLFLIIQIIINLSSNFAISYQAKKRFPYLNLKENAKLDNKILLELKRNVIGSISSKIGLIAVTGTDNILISKFISISAVGYYANYSLVVSGVTSLLSQMISAITATLGHFGISERDKLDKRYEVFMLYTYLSAVITSFIAGMLIILFKPFIVLWLGSGYVLNQITTIAIILSFVFAQFRPAQQMIAAYGLFWGYRYKSIVEAIVNVGVSFILVKFTSLGITGVLIGTILGNIVINSWWDVCILFTGAFPKKSIKKYIFTFFKYVVSILFLVLINVIIRPYLLNFGGVFGFLILIVQAIAVQVVIIIVAFCWSFDQKVTLKKIEVMLENKLGR